MIRARYVRWNQRRYSDAERLLAAVEGFEHCKWIDRYVDWDVAKYGESGPQPWWDRCVVGRFIIWCDDWRNLLSAPLYLKKAIKSFRTADRTEQPQ